MLRAFWFSVVVIVATLTPPVPIGAADAVVKTGCPAIDDFRLRAQHGTFVAYADGKLDDESVSEIQAVREELGLQPAPPEQIPQTVVVHVHGGLVDRCQGVGDAVSLGPIYRAAGAFPIFPVYRIGLGESLSNGRRNIGAYAVYDPRAESVFGRMNHINGEARFRADNGRDHFDDHTTKREERYRYGAFVNGGLWTGGRAWSYMKGVVDHGMRIDSAAGDPVVDGPVKGAPGGLAIAEVLHDYMTANPRANVVLVGHSTGAIWITKFLRAWQRKYHADSEPQRFSVIFMAPAVRYDDFAKCSTATRTARRSISSRTYVSSPCATRSKHM